MAENQVKVRPTLTDLEVGKAVTFPIEKTKSVRAQASDLGLILNVGSALGALPHFCGRFPRACPRTVLTCLHVHGSPL